MRSLGPTLAVAASHPHMYGVQTEWARALGDVPVLVAAPDARVGAAGADPLVELYDERREVAPDSPCTGWAGTSAAGRRRVDSGRRGPGRAARRRRGLPQPGPPVGQLHAQLSEPDSPVGQRRSSASPSQLEGLHFDRLYNNFGAVVPSDAKAVLRCSADRHAAWVRGDFDHLT